MKIHQLAVKSARIEMLPLIDIVFLLLVFFIYAMLSMAVHRGLQLDLPESSTAVSSEDDSVSVSIRDDGTTIECFLNKRPLPLDQLAGELMQMRKRTASPLSVQLFATESVSYQQLYQVLDELNRAGIADISLQASSE
jgi:biopolymer transport protein ExbD